MYHLFLFYQIRPQFSFWEFLGGCGLSQVVRSGQAGCLRAAVAPRVASSPRASSRRPLAFYLVQSLPQAISIKNRRTFSFGKKKPGSLNPALLKIELFRSLWTQNQALTVVVFSILNFYHIHAGGKT